MSDLVVSVDNVSKKFCRSLKRGMFYTASDLTRDAFGLRSSPELRPSEFWSVSDVSFEMRAGDCLGLIGANGAGKSTLLKMLNGIIRPDRGSIRIKGRVGAMIEVGAGFHPMLSGRENIYINGAVLGMNKREIDRKFDSIVDFSGLSSEVLDAPVKTYSSGMYVRLGFAVAAHCEPDILLIDEVLAVGDIQFFAKCKQRLDHLRAAGVTFIFVSHSLPQVEALCDRTILLHQGQVLEYGPSRMVTMRLREMMTQDPGMFTRRSADELPVRGVTISTIQVLDGAGNDMTEVPCGDEVTVRIRVKADTPLREATLSVFLYRNGYDMVACSGSLRFPEDVQELKTGVYDVRARFAPMPGEYKVGVTIAGKDLLDIYDETWTKPFLVCPTARVPMPRPLDSGIGVCYMPLELGAMHQVA